MVVQYLVGGQLTQILDLDVVESVGEYLQESVQSSPGLLDKHLGQELVEEPLNTQRFNLRVDQ